MSKASTKTLAARGMVAPSLTSTNQSIFHYKTDTEWKDISDELIQSFHSCPDHV